MCVYAALTRRALQALMVADGSWCGMCLQAGHGIQHQTSSMAVKPMAIPLGAL